MKTGIKISILILMMVLLVCCIYFDNLEEVEVVNDKEKVANVSLYYNNYVITTDNKSIYMKQGDSYVKVGNVYSGIELSLNGIVDNYFKIDNLDDDYYINYEDLDKIDSLTEVNNRYENYVSFGEKIITNDITNFYDEEKLIYTIDKSFEFVILVKDGDRYGIVYNNRLLYIKSDDIAKIVVDESVGGTNTKGIGVLNYHFFYDEEVDGESSKCNQDICVSKSQFKIHLDYIKDNNFFTPTMNELEMYIDGKIQLPKSVVITIDDGWRAELGIKMLTDYKLNATMFLVTSWYDPKNFKTDFVEVHSHTDNMHNIGECPYGQGGGIQCLDKDIIINDLKTSSNKLNGSTVLCYPFYEYNDFSIEALKEAGFTMAFAGESFNSDNLVKVGSNKYKLPRFVVVNYTTMSDLKNYLN